MQEATCTRTSTKTQQLQQLLKKAPSLVPVRLLTRNRIRNLQLGGRRKTKSCWFEIHHCLLKFHRNSWNMQLFQFKGGEEILPLSVDRCERINMKENAWTRQKEKKIKSTFFYSHFFWNLTIVIGVQTAAHGLVEPQEAQLTELTRWPGSENQPWKHSRATPAGWPPKEEDGLVLCRVISLNEFLDFGPFEERLFGILW